MDTLTTRNSIPWLHLRYVPALPAASGQAGIREHSKRYAFCGSIRVANDVRASDATVSRLLSRCGSPSYALIIRITQALEKEFKRSIDPREVASLTGEYPTASVCDVVGCNGCSPEEAWNEENELTLP